jgi:uncharacterized protein (TIGR02145 family)
MLKIKFISTILIISMATIGCVRIIGLTNSVRVDEKTLIDKSEVDIASWLSYYTWVLNHKGIQEAKKVLPDSSAIDPIVWEYIKKNTETTNEDAGTYTSEKIGNFCKDCDDLLLKYKTEYYSNSGCVLLYLPITGLNYEQVSNFCKWRSEIQGNSKVLYRLPSPEEWTKIAKLSEGANAFLDSVEKFEFHRFNYNFKGKSSLSLTFSSKSKKNRLYDLLGNVSEMTNKEGIAKGGNYLQYAIQCNPDSVQYYSKPEKWLGFRCLVVKINKNEVLSDLKKNKQLQNDSAFILKMSGKTGQFTDNRDGRIYKSVKIGDQIWMSENLAYKPDSCKYWSYYSKSKIPTYGYLYNWVTAQEVCPIGWHLPDKSEFEILLQNIGGDGSSAYKELIDTENIGFSMLEGGLHFWFGYNDSHGSAFWTSSEFNKKVGVTLCRGGYAKTARIDNFFKSSGVYVRCIKDK